MSVPTDPAALAIWREASIEAALHDGHGWPVFDMSEMFRAGMAEIMFLLVELDAPTPTGTAHRRAKAINLLAEMMRAGKGA